jgi:NTE family protein
VAGIAWETGILCGIADQSPEAASALLAADVLLGTSAGSTVAAQLSSGATLEELFARQTAAQSHEIDSGVDVADIAELFVTAMLTPGATTEQKLQRIGEIAVSTDTVAESVRREVIAHRLPSHDWPERVLRVTAIDVATGLLVVFDSNSGVDLVDAVAASCAVPGVWPTVTIAGRRYMDGGVGSIVNTAAAADCTTLIVLVPSGQNSPSPFGDGAVREIAALGDSALAVFADDDALTAFGRNPLDPACRVPSAHAGRAQGRREAQRVAEFLGL